MRKVFLDNLPKGGLNRGNRINWESSVGYKVSFIYDDIEGEFEIVEYENKTEYIYIKYLDNEPFKIKIGNLKNCYLGNILGIKISTFRIEIGQVFKDDKRDLVITDREIRVRYKKNGDKCNDKYYKYKCNKCENEDWILESDLLTRERGCNVCAGKKVVFGINSIFDTAKWMIPIINDEEFCKTHTHSCSDRIYPTCPDCGRKLNKSSKINNIFNFHSVGCTCSDNIPYTEKLMFSLLGQLGLNFKTQLNRVIFEWCDKYKYDFYFEHNNEKYIVETHGEQHYIQTRRKNARDLEKEQANDKYKRKLALQNGIKEENYIIVDCRKSNLDFIKQNILNSKLSEMFDLSIVNWNKCEEFALSNRVKEACELWNSGIKSTKEIGEMMKLSFSTIIRYLKKGTKLGLCDYNSKEELIKSCKKNGKTGTKPIICLENKMIFKSARECEINSIEIFGFKINHGYLSNICNGKRNDYKGYRFKFISDLTQEERIKYNVEVI